MKRVIMALLVMMSYSSLCDEAGNQTLVGEVPAFCYLVTMS